MRDNHYIKLLIVGISVLVSACIQSKQINKGNVFYKLIKDNNGDDVLLRYKVKEPFKADITDKGGYITLSPDDEDVINDTVDTKYVSLLEKKNKPIIINKPITGTDALIQASGSYFFKKTDFDTTKSKRSKFVYMDTKFMLQTLSIPLKIRPALNGPEFGNKFPQQVETDFNFGFAAGWKFNKNIYRPDVNLLGLNINRISIAPGLLVNLGSTELDDKNTIPAITVERKAFTYSTGIVLLFGFNTVNVGIARGVDYVTGSGKGDWVYQGRPWTGIIVALDLLK